MHKAKGVIIMKEYKKLCMEIFVFVEDIVTLSNWGNGGDVGSSGDGDTFNGFSTQ